MGWSQFFHWLLSGGVFSSSWFPVVQSQTVSTKRVCGLRKQFLIPGPPRDVNPNILPAGVSLGRQGSSGPIQSPPHGLTCLIPKCAL